MRQTIVGADTGAAALRDAGTRPDYELPEGPRVLTAGDLAFAARAMRLAEASRGMDFRYGDGPPPASVGPVREMPEGLLAPRVVWSNGAAAADADERIRAHPVARALADACGFLAGRAPGAETVAKVVAPTLCGVRGMAWTDGRLACVVADAGRGPEVRFRGPDAEELAAAWEARRAAPGPR